MGMIGVSPLGAGTGRIYEGMAGLYDTVAAAAKARAPGNAIATLDGVLAGDTR